MTSQNTKVDTDSAEAPVKGVGCGALVSPMALRISIEGNRGTPLLASVIARILKDYGAHVTFGDNKAEMPEKLSANLYGLHVHIDRLTWVRDEESARWVDRSSANTRNQPTP